MHFLALLSANHLVGQGSNSFRRSKDVNKGNVEIIAVTPIMTNTISMVIAATRASCGQYNHYC